MPSNMRDLGLIGKELSEIRDKIAAANAKIATKTAERDVLRSDAACLAASAITNNKMPASVAAKRAQVTKLDADIRFLQDALEELHRREGLLTDEIANTKNAEAVQICQMTVGSYAAAYAEACWLVAEFEADASAKVAALQALRKRMEKSRPTEALSRLPEAARTSLFGDIFTRIRDMPPLRLDLDALKDAAASLDNSRFAQVQHMTMIGPRR